MKSKTLRFFALIQLCALCEKEFISRRERKEDTKNAKINGCKRGTKAMFTIIEDYEIIIFPSPDKDERWLYVRFPDIPEILTGGSTIDDAIQNAKEAFQCHTEALQKQGKEMPLPSRRLTHIKR